MERRGCGLGCIILGLGLMLTLCLMPYLISSVYSLVAAILQVPVPANWLWGDWLNTAIGEYELLYMLLAEGPMCCVGTIGLLIVILGLVLMIIGIGQGGEEHAQEEYAQEYASPEEYTYSDEQYASPEEYTYPEEW
jgi:hypothetical protein